MWHPLELIPNGSVRWLVFSFFLILTVGLFALMAPSSKQLTTQAAPWGIVSLELAGNPKNAQDIINSWQAKDAIKSALTNIYLDYFFLLAYSTTIALACIIGANALGKNAWLGRDLGLLLAWLQWLAALLDAIENVALKQMVNSLGASPWPQIALICAIPKFILILLGIAYSLVGFSASVMSR